jgi:hypothetical protein
MRREYTGKKKKNMKLDERNRIMAAVIARNCRTAKNMSTRFCDLRK